MSSAPASEIQKNFGEWHDKAYEGPVEITRYGRTTAYLVSAKLFREMWASYRKIVAVEDLSDSDIAMIREAKVETSELFNLSDIPEVDEAPGAPRMG